MAFERVSVTVDAALCVGSGTCVGLAAAHFRMSDDGVAEPVEDVTVADDDLLDAEESCPVQAIRLTLAAES